MEFFYPNWINDFWRIMGLIHFNDKAYFEVENEKRFDRERIVAFSNNEGLAFFDTASKVRRMKDNASDNFLEIIEQTDVCKLLLQMPQCNQVVTTGTKASEELLIQFTNVAVSLGLDKPEKPTIGEYSLIEACGRTIRWWRMPSSSRAYPLALPKKAEFYKRLFE